MKLVYSRTSPYVRKVRVLLAEKNLDCDLVEDNVWSPDTAIARYNPLGKVPSLVLDDGRCLYDSAVITEYLDGLSEPALIPHTGVERAHARRLEALADGICDAAVTIVLERRRDASRQDASWMERHRTKVERGLAAIVGELGAADWLGGARPTLADIAAGCALFYVEFRLPEYGCRAQHPHFARWAARLEERASFAATRPPPA